MRAATVHFPAGYAFPLCIPSLLFVFFFVGVVNILVIFVTVATVVNVVEELLSNLIQAQSSTAVQPNTPTQANHNQIFAFTFLL